MIKCTS